MRISLVVITAVVSLAVSGAASAATVTAVQGKVSINRGAGFKPVAGGTGAAAGDRVMVGKDSAGQIVYENGCTVEVAAGQVITVAAKPPCGAAGADAGFLTGGGAAPVIVGVAVVAGAVAAIASSNDDDNDKPASP
jgi:hypothetical protein